VRVLVAGAAGFLGRSIVRAFAGGGHEVVGLVRASGQAATVRADGGEPAVGDLLAPRSLAAPLHGVDLAIHVAQPSEGSLARLREVRVQGAEHLVTAARAARVPRLLIGSGYWVYRDSAEPITEESPIAPLSLSQVNFDCEEVGRRAMRDGSLEVSVLRPGMVYGPGSWFREMVTGIRDGSYRFIEPGSNYLSPVHLADAGEAFRAVAERWKGGETYLVVDDAPAPTREFAEFVAGRLGTRVRGMPFAQASAEWGEELARLNAASRRASNRKLRGLGWRPRFPEYRAGVPGVLSELGAELRGSSA
jgi:nucleoside-diphosphate-sugar epimerase